MGSRTTEWLGRSQGCGGASLRPAHRSALISCWRGCARVRYLHVLSQFDATVKRDVLT